MRRRIRKGKLVTPETITAVKGVTFSTRRSAMFADSTGLSTTVENAHVGHLKDLANAISSTQTSTSSKPIFKRSNTIKYIDFDGIDDSLNFTTSLIADSSDYTIVVSFKSANVVGTATVFSITGTNAAILFQTVDGVPQVKFIDDSSTVTTLSSGMTTQAWLPLTMSLVKIGSTRILKVNGVERARANIPGVTTFTNAYIGSNKDTSEFFEGVFTNLYADDSYIGGRNLSVLEQRFILENNLSSSDVTASVNDVSVDESAGTCAFTVSLNRESPNVVTVNYYTTENTATASDFTPILTPLTLTFQPGELFKTVSVSITEDATIEGVETFYLDLASPVNCTIAKSRGIGSIRQSDKAPAVYFNGNVGLFSYGSMLNMTYSKKVTYAFRVKMENLSTDFVEFVGFSGNTYIEKRSGGALRIYYNWYNPVLNTSGYSNTTYWSASSFSPTDNWRTIIVSMDMDLGYIDYAAINNSGTVSVSRNTTLLPGTVNGGGDRTDYYFNTRSSVSILNDFSKAGTSLVNAFYGKVEWGFIHVGAYLDLNTGGAANENVAKFTYNNFMNNPTAITGSMPQVILCGTANEWNAGLNRGNGGTLTVNGVGYITDTDI